MTSISDPATLLLVRRVVVRHVVILHQRRPDPEEDLERVRDLVAVISIQAVRHVMNRELSAKPNVNAASVGEITHISQRPGVDREYRVMIDLVQDELVSRFFDMLVACVKRVPPALVVGLDQERLRLVAAVPILSPNERA